ncbi:energy transducer TonB [Selenomonas sp. oral taxon 136]|uniref:energy transducer TonB n=1 Tax=Selenomonas sp. oral taxon 136 TaxID=713030 RepID=UPI000768174A|nr:energy transducer TonB [Selenomonas sp. oral taxon 136]AME02941.1 energy transducer TonB [Selenomonas sp. oral taxon 136]
MDTVMEEKRGTYTALSLSLALHVILLLAAGALGLFSIAVPQTGDTPVEVTLYDAGSPAAAAAGDAAPAPAVSAVSDVVIVDKTLPPETPQETPEQTSNPQTSAAAPSKPSDGTQTGTTGSSGGGDTAGTGTKGGTSGTSGGGDAAPAAPPAPPAERVAASLRAEATPEYPQELIEDDVEGSVTVKILVAADGSVESVKLVSSSGYSAMDRAAIAAGYRFQFNPGDNGRKGVFPWTFYFRLE